MIIRQTTTIVFEYPQDYLQEQEWCKTKEDRWVHKSTDTLGAVYENTISYSIGQPNSSEKPNNCEDEPQTDCGDFADRLAYERGVKHAWEVAQKVFNSTVTFYEAEDFAKQIDKDINVRSKDEPQTENLFTDKYGDVWEWRGDAWYCISGDEPQTETEIAKAIVHKMIDDAVIAEDAYPDLRQKMHDAVDEYEPQTDCAWK